MRIIIVHKQGHQYGKARTICSFIIPQTVIAQLAGHKSLYGWLNSWEGHIGIYGRLMAHKQILVEQIFNIQIFFGHILWLEIDLMANKKKFSWKQIFIQKCFSRKKLLLDQNVGTFSTINRLQHGCSGHTGIYSTLRSGS